MIKSVLSNIAKRSVDRLPSKTTLCDMMVECLTVAQSQLGEQLHVWAKIISHYIQMEPPNMVNILVLMM